jgi:hypothetical protein
MLMTLDMKEEETIFSKVRDEYWKTYWLAFWNI